MGKTIATAPLGDSAFALIDVKTARELSRKIDAMSENELRAACCNLAVTLHGLRNELLEEHAIRIELGR